MTDDDVDELGPVDYPVVECIDLARRAGVM